MRKFLFTSALFCTLVSFAQTISTDRPTQSLAPHVVPGGRLQLETGFIFEQVNSDFSNIVFNSTLLRYGVNGRYEVRLGFDFVQQDDVDFSSGQEFRNSGFTPFFLGVKVKLSEQKGIIPNFSFVGQIFLPNEESGSPVRQSFITPEFRFLSEYSLGDRVTLGYNWGLRWFDADLSGVEDFRPTTLYSAYVTVRTIKSLSVYFEPFIFLREDEDSDFRVNAGLLYLINDKIQFDVEGGVGISDIAPSYFVGGGISFSFLK